MRRESSRCRVCRAERERERERLCVTSSAALTVNQAGANDAQRTQTDERSAKDNRKILRVSQKPETDGGYTETDEADSNGQKRQTCLVAGYSTRPPTPRLTDWYEAMRAFLT